MTVKKLIGTKVILRPIDRCEQRDQPIKIPNMLQLPVAFSKRRKKSGVQSAIGFVLASHSLRNWREILRQSPSVLIAIL